jgi:hypothetical protein
MMHVLISTPFENYPAAAQIVAKIGAALLDPSEDGGAEVSAVTDEGLKLASNWTPISGYSHLWPNGNLYSDETDDQPELVVAHAETFIADCYVGPNSKDYLLVEFAVLR